MTLLETRRLVWAISAPVEGTHNFQSDLPVHLWRGLTYNYRFLKLIVPDTMWRAYSVTMRSAVRSSVVCLVFFSVLNPVCLMLRAASRTITCGEDH